MATEQAQLQAKLARGTAFLAPPKMSDKAQGKQPEDLFIRPLPARRPYSPYEPDTLEREERSYEGYGPRKYR